MTPIVSQTYFGKDEPFELQVSRGLIPNHRAIFRSAYSASITLSQNYAIWPRAANYTFPPSASVMKLSSSATGDVGQLVLVTGLNNEHDEISEVLVLNGQNAVNSTFSYLRINGLQILTDSPTGDIYLGTGALTAGVPANVYGFIAAGDGTMMCANYSVPVGHTLFIQGGSINGALGNANKLITVSFNTIINGVTYKGARIITSGGYQHYPYTPPIAVPEKSDLLDTATTTDTTLCSVTANLSGILIKNFVG